MKTRWSVGLLVGCVLASFALLSAQSDSGNQTAEEKAVRSMGQEWFKSYASGDVSGLVALYADDAVVNPPDMPPARGQAAIRDYFTKDIAAANGVNLNPGPNPEITVSGDLAFEWNTYTVTDKSGATVGTGKYLTAYTKRDGKWLVIRDIWNSDAPTPMQTGKQ